MIVTFTFDSHAGILSVRVERGIAGLHSESGAISYNPDRQEGVMKLAIGFVLLNPLSAQQPPHQHPPSALAVPLHPLAQHVRPLEHPLNYLGQPLSPAEHRRI